MQLAPLVFHYKQDQLMRMNERVFYGEQDKEEGISNEGSNPPQLIVEYSNKPSATVTPPWSNNMSINPYAFLSNIEFVQIACRNIHGAIWIEEEMKRRSLLADDLFKVLYRRLTKHICKRIEALLKHNYPALIFVWLNLNCFAALLVLFNQTRKCSIVSENI